MNKYGNDGMTSDIQKGTEPKNAGFTDILTESGSDHMCAGIIHVVQNGDTLYRLSGRYHVSVSDIMYSNPYANVYNLQAGDEICIPVSGSAGEMRDQDGEGYFNIL